MTTPYLTSIPTSGTTTVTTHDGWQLTWFVEPSAPFAIHAWNLSSPTPDGGPFWYQPHDLNGANWPDQTTATSFAQSWIQEHFLTAPAATTATTAPAASAAPAAATTAPAAPAAPASN